MKVFITVDYEGVAGMVTWDSTERQREREFMTADANAAIAGAFDGGATEVLVGEAHATMRNIIPESIDARARFLTGRPKGLNHMHGIDETFDAAMLVAYHARQGTERAVMAHTYAHGVYSLRVNGVEVGELGADAGIAGAHGVPVVLVTGDEATCEEARELLGPVETVAVKEGVSHAAAICLPPAEARRQITGAACVALSRREEMTPLQFEAPVEIEITFASPRLADAACLFPQLERLDGRRVRLCGSDYLEAFMMFNAAHFLAGAI